MKKATISLALVTAFCFSMVYSQDITEEGQDFFIRAVIYPTFSLSRYDYNNDLNHTEIRAYVNLRLGSPHGKIITDANVKVNGSKLEFSENNYEKRIPVKPENLPDEITLDIKGPGGFIFSRTFPVPDWLVIQAPQPSIVDNNSDLTLNWSFRQFGRPVNVSVYNFKTGDEILNLDYYAESEAVIPAADLREGILLRILVVCSWIYKEYIRGENIAGGSEINMVPWSQVFIRTK